MGLRVPPSYSSTLRAWTWNSHSLCPPKPTQLSQVSASELDRRLAVAGRGLALGFKGFGYRSTFRCFMLVCGLVWSLRTSTSEFFHNFHEIQHMSGALGLFILETSTLKPLGVQAFNNPL